MKLIQNRLQKIDENFNTKTCPLFSPNFSAWSGAKLLQNFATMQDMQIIFAKSQKIHRNLTFADFEKKAKLTSNFVEVLRLERCKNVLIL